MCPCTVSLKYVSDWGNYSLVCPLLSKDTAMCHPLPGLYLIMDLSWDHVSFLDMKISLEWRSIHCNTVSSTDREWLISLREKRMPLNLGFVPLTLCLTSSKDFSSYQIWHVCCGQQLISNVLERLVKEVGWDHGNYSLWCVTNIVSWHNSPDWSR